MRKCAYCDFASLPGAGRDKARYLRALDAEMAARAAQYGRLTLGSVFVGGGTPSILTAGEIARLFDIIRRHFEIVPGAEITMEANPGTLDAGKLRAMREAGVNRLSVGMQAAQDRLLKAIGRVHTFEDTVEAVRMAREAGFQNISVDIMYGLPGQTTEDMRGTLEAALALGVQHISAYSLILEEGTPLFRAVEAGEASLPGEDDEFAMHRMAVEALPAAGYGRYEVSNYALPGFECRHNITYWTRGDYLGVGCAAHSFMRGERFASPEDVDGYVAWVERGSGGDGGSDGARRLDGGSAHVEGTIAPRAGGNGGHESEGLAVERLYASLTGEPGEQESEGLVVEQLFTLPLLNHLFIDDAAAREETLMLGLRMTQGIDRADYRARFGRDIAEEYATPLGPLIAQGYVCLTGGWLRLTDRGMDMMNWVLGRLVGG